MAKKEIKKDDDKMKSLLGKEVKVENTFGTIVGFQDEYVIIEADGELFKKKFADVSIKKEKVKKDYELSTEEKKMLKEIDFVDTQNILPVLMTAIKEGMITGLRGPTGTGKTHLIQQLALANKKNLTILNMNCNTTTDEFKGKYSLTEEGKLAWIKSAVVKCMEAGQWLCIEEANFMSEELASVLYSLLDYRKNLVIDEHEGEVIEAEAGFRVFLTMNPNYDGTTRMNDAIVNRIALWLDVEYLDATEEAKLLSERYSSADKETVKILTTIAEAIRKKGEFRHLSTRTLENTCRLLQLGYSFKDAIQITMINTLTDDSIEKKKIQEIVNLYYESTEDYESLSTKIDRE